MTTQPESTDVEKEIAKHFTLLMDDIIEDMESYVETDSNKSYQDELFDRINHIGSQFIKSAMRKVREETLVNLAVEVQPIAQKQVDKSGNYYITLEQLHSIIKELQNK